MNYHQVKSQREINIRNKKLHLKRRQILTCQLNDNVDKTTSTFLYPKFCCRIPKCRRCGKDTKVNERRNKRYNLKKESNKLIY